MGLILTRREGESIFIVDNESCIDSNPIEIKLLKLDFNLNRASLQIMAPKEFYIHRGEIYKRILEEGYKTKEELALGRDNIGNK